MTVYQAEDKARLRRELSKEAIALAMQSRWEQALKANRGILEVFPTDVEALNRLGKALTELGRYAEARDAFSKALEVAPNNPIAKRNLQRLALLRDGRPFAHEEPRPVSPDLFIEATGKAGFTTLIKLAPGEVLAPLAAGDPVNLHIQGNFLVAKDWRGEYIGQVEPKLALRLMRLMQGGNKYTAAVASSSERAITIIIRETYQHPSQRGRISFPAKGGLEDFRPYIRGGLVRYELAEEEEEPSSGETDGEWEGEEKVKDVVEEQDEEGGDVKERPVAVTTDEEEEEV